MSGPAVVVVMTVPPPQTGEHAIHIIFPLACPLEGFETFSGPYQKIACSAFKNNALLWEFPVSEKMDAFNRKFLASLLAERIKVSFGEGVRVIIRERPMLA